MREFRQKVQLAYRDACQLVLAMRVGAPITAVSVSVTISSEPDRDTGDFTCTPYRAAIEGSALEAMMEFDPDPLLVAEALEEIPFAEMEASQVAEHIVGALRVKIEPEDA